MIRTRRTATALTAAAALALGVLPAAFTTTSILAGGEEPTTLDSGTDYYFPGPTLTLSTTPDLATVTLSDSTMTQQFDGGQYCLVTNTDESDDLLSLSGARLDEDGTVSASTPALAGFRDGSIGVFEGTNASQCFRVDANSFTSYEALTVGLGTALQGLVAEAASLDLEMKSNDAKIRVEAFYGTNPDPVTFTDGTTTSPKLTLYTGKARPKVAGPFERNYATRSGGHIPLAIGTGPTEPNRLSGPFTRIRLTAMTGSFTLEGGTDAGNGPSTISLAQPADAGLCPSQSYSSGTATVTYLGEPVPDPDTNPLCFGIQLIGTDDYVRFLKPPDIATDAEFVFTIDWSIDTPDGDAQVPATVVDFTNSPATTDDVPIGWCHDATYDAEGVLTGLATTPSESPYACVATQDAKTVGDTLEVTEQVYVYGDVIMRKP